jgi:hypothetical protein
VSGSTLVFIIIPVGVFIGLIIWIMAVFRAERSTGGGGGDPLGRQVAGGIFRNRGGRQVMPRRDAPAAAPTPAAAAGQQDDTTARTRPGRGEQLESDVRED